MPETLPVTVLGAEFVGEARDVAQLPAAGPPEVAIAGRSNVGKSTLLNRMAARKALARVSKTPGRTRGLVLFDLELRLHATGTRQRLRLVDLPGYGYAQVSQAERRAWQTLVEGYVQQPRPLGLVLVLVDARRELAAEEMQLLEWLTSLNIPRHLVVTKADKLGASERGALSARLRKQPTALGASITMVSGVTGEGIDVLWSRIARIWASHKDDEALGTL